MISYLLKTTGGFTWKEFFLGDEEWHFLPEVLLRSFIMFLVIVLALRVLGKRGVKQLSIFELVVIIGLGSAAGDPMFYKDVGLLPAILVFLMVVVLYKIIMTLIGHSKKIEDLVEGKCICLISEGKFTIENFRKAHLAQDEFFSELRGAGVKHLGQVELAIIETSGNISIFFYEDEKVKYGLPVLPALYAEQFILIAKKGMYSCAFCGYTSELETASTCPVCEKKKWVKSINLLRVP